jgi:glycosyltransferase involved in cell wall biosynthesis
MYAAIGMVSSPAIYPRAPRQKFAVIICARNEANVIANLLTDLRKQRYDHDKLDVFVVADNCTDETAKVARENGANVFERFSQEEIGKGFALTFIFDKLLKLDAVKDYDAFFIFDADNRLSPNYIAKMNDAFSSGYDVVTSYRNSSNFGENWVAAGSALWFIRESRLYNNSRQRVNLNAHVG